MNERVTVMDIENLTKSLFQVVDTGIKSKKIEEIVLLVLVNS